MAGLNRKSGARAKSLAQPNPNSREAILAAALKAFAQGGFEGASLPKIARMANVAPPLIHYYFNTKDNLWRETVDYSLGELRRESSAILNATKTLAPLDRLRVLLGATTHFAARCPDHFSMIVAEARADSEHYAWLQENYTGILFHDILAILEDARDRKQIKDVPLEHLAFMLVGGILVRFSTDPGVGKARNVEQLADEYIDMLFVVLMEGLVARP
jgi:AcrR family transcriptional regulator